MSIVTRGSYINLCLSKFTSCLKIPIKMNSAVCTVTVLGAFARYFLTFGRSSVRDIIIALSGHAVGGDNRALPPQDVIISRKKEKSIRLSLNLLNMFCTMC